MKTIITMIAVLLSLQVLAVKSIKHETCNVVMANGHYYGGFSNYEMPKDYFKKFVNVLERKGYNVVDQMNIGTYFDHNYVYSRAYEQRGLSLIFRSSYAVISADMRNKRTSDHICKMALDLATSTHAVTKKDIYISKEALLFKNNYRTSLCNKLFRSIKRAIPKCEIK